VSSIDSRRELLVAESELNRAQLVDEGLAMSEAVRIATARLKSIGSVVSVAAVVLGGVSALRRGHASPAVARFSWLGMALKGAKIAGSIWLAMRARRP